MQVTHIGTSYDGELSPEAAEIVSALEDPDAPPVHEMDLKTARTTHALEDYDIALITEGIQVTEKTLQTERGGIKCRFYTPEKGDDFPVLVFAHGGCWTFCSLDSHDRLCRFFAQQVNCIVVSVDYLLAPEAPFPAGLNDYCAVIEWCMEEAETIHGNPNRIALAGDSAGGNLAAVAAQRYSGVYRFRHQLLIYPICEVGAPPTPSMHRYSEGYFFTQDVLDWTGTGYVAETAPSHPEISPQHGKVSELLAPATIILAECDILHDQGLRYAETLHQAKVSVNCQIYHGMPHAFIAMAGALPLGQDALNYGAEQLKQALHT